MENPANTGKLVGLPGAEERASEALLPTTQYLSLSRDWKPPLEMYQPGSGVTIIIGTFSPMDFVCVNLISFVC